jgi:hypothetical protein
MNFEVNTAVAPWFRSTRATDGYPTPIDPDDRQ